MKRASDPGWPTRLLARPALVGVLWLTWLALNQSLQPAQVLLGLVLALVCAAIAGPPPRGAAPAADVPTPHADAPPTPARTSSLQRLRTAVMLCLRVLRDIMQANLQVARLILGPQERLSPGFVTVPLTVKDARAIGLLCAIVTMTPGTISAELNDDHSQLRVHALDLRDPAALVSEIRERYERPLLELFE